LRLIKQIQLRQAKQTGRFKKHDEAPTV